MDRRLMIKELAALVGVSEDTVINWELKGVKPKSEQFKRMREVLGIWGGSEGKEVKYGER